MSSLTEETQKPRRYPSTMRDRYLAALESNGGNTSQTYGPVVKIDDNHNDSDYSPISTSSNSSDFTNNSRSGKGEDQENRRPPQSNDGKGDTNKSNSFVGSSSEGFMDSSILKKASSLKKPMSNTKNHGFNNVIDSIGDNNTSYKSKSSNSPSVPSLDSNKRLNSIWPPTSPTANKSSNKHENDTSPFRSLKKNNSNNINNGERKDIITGATITPPNANASNSKGNNFSSFAQNYTRTKSNRLNTSNSTSTPNNTSYSFNTNTPPMSPSRKQSNGIITASFGSTDSNSNSSNNAFKPINAAKAIKTNKSPAVKTSDTWRERRVGRSPSNIASPIQKSPENDGGGDDNNGDVDIFDKVETKDSSCLPSSISNTRNLNEENPNAGSNKDSTFSSSSNNNFFGFKLRSTSSRFAQGKEEDVNDFQHGTKTKAEDTVDREVIEASDNLQPLQNNDDFVAFPSVRKRAQSFQNQETEQQQQQQPTPSSAANVAANAASELLSQQKSSIKPSNAAGNTCSPYKSQQTNSLPNLTTKHKVNSNNSKKSDDDELSCVVPGVSTTNKVNGGVAAAFLAAVNKTPSREKTQQEREQDNTDCSYLTSPPFMFEDSSPMSSFVTDKYLNHPQHVASGKKGGGLNTIGALSSDWEEINNGGIPFMPKLSEGEKGGPSSNNKSSTPMTNKRESPTGSMRSTNIIASWRKRVSSNSSSPEQKNNAPPLVTAPPPSAGNATVGNKKSSNKNIFYNYDSAPLSPSSMPSTVASECPVFPSTATDFNFSDNDVGGGDGGAPINSWGNVSSSSDVQRPPSGSSNNQGQQQQQTTLANLINEMELRMEARMLRLEARLESQFKARLEYMEAKMDARLEEMKNSMVLYLQDIEGRSDVRGRSVNNTPRNGEI